MGARFRLSTQTGLGPDGPAPDGEVEDYLLRVVKPTLIELAQFGATPGEGYNDVYWETTLEINTLGFLIYRGTVNDPAQATQMLRDRIPAKGSTGGTYSFRDDVAIETGVQYFYWLVEAEQAAGGEVSFNFYGPVTLVNNFGKPGGGNGNLYLPLISR